jgi:hypothetical protein
MKIAILQPIGGASGDMILASFINSGVPQDFLSEQISTVIRRKITLSLSHSNVDTFKAARLNLPNFNKEHLCFEKMLNFIEHSHLKTKIKNAAASVIRQLLSVEKEVHGKIHSASNHNSHGELETIDTLIDILGVSISWYYLSIEKGFVTTIFLNETGLYNQIPLPAPATIGLLKGYNLSLVKENVEMVTPTAAAIIKCFFKSIADEILLIFNLKSTSISTGKNVLNSRPNICRLMVGETKSEEGKLKNDEVWLVETNIDDMNPQYFAPLIEDLLHHGAIDCFVTPIQMKKSRPGWMLSVLTNDENVQELASFILNNTTTTGVRIDKKIRFKLSRQLVQINTEYGQAKVKIIKRGNYISIHPEYESCLKIAKENNMPIDYIYKKVLMEAMEAKEKY